MSNGTVKMPSSLEVALRTAPVSTFRTATAAPRMTAPEVSVTDPLTEPVVV